MELIKCVNGISEEGVLPFVLNKGEVILFLLHSGRDVEFCANNQKNLQIETLPYWVEFQIKKVCTKEVDIINENKKYLYQFFSNDYNIYKTLTKRDFLMFSGGEIRIVNMFLMRTYYQIKFFEINLAGLAPHSICAMFKFIFCELKNDPQLTYMVVDIKSTLTINCASPILVNKENIDFILTRYIKR